MQTWGKQDLRTGLDHAAREQRELHIVADQDSDPAERGIEYLQGVARSDMPVFPLEAGHDELVLKIA